MLRPGPGETFLDCTVGLGGHAALIAHEMGPSGTIILNDLDAGNLEVAVRRLQGLSNAPHLIPLRGNFAEAPRRLAERGLTADMVLADLGFASCQVDDPGRGLSFSQAGPLDMRLDPSGPVTAAALVNTLGESELQQIIREYGEERHAGLVARRIVEARRADPIQTTDRLAAVVRDALRRASGGSGGIDPATRTFQALRIAVNDELGNLGALLESITAAARSARRGEGTPWLRRGARIGIISFHSLEDRPVKQTFASLVREGLAVDLTRKPIVADEAEATTNPRSRSAKLRAIRLTDENEASSSAVPQPT